MTKTQQLGHARPKNVSVIGPKSILDCLVALRSYAGVVRTLLFFCTLTALMAADSPRHVLVHGHRGARAMRPENTLPAFEYAIAAGVDFLELDMAVTKDNVLVVSHDPVLEAPVCKGPKAMAVIHQLTLAQVREYEC